MTKEATYEPTKQELDQIERIYNYAPKLGLASRYGQLRDHAKTLATEILSECPSSRERSLAMTKLEEAIMWANASIARNEP